MIHRQTKIEKHSRETNEPEGDAVVIDNISLWDR